MSKPLENYIIRIKSSIDQFDNEGVIREEDRDHIELMTRGSFTKKNGSYYISYKETQTIGFEGCTTTIKIAEDGSRVALLRFGRANSQLLIERDRRNLCHYETEVGSLTLGVTGDGIDCKLTEKGGSAAFSYLLDADDAWEPGFLAEIAAMIRKFPGCGLYCTAFSIISHDGTYPAPTPSERGVVANFFRESAHRYIAIPSASCIPRRVFDTVGLFPEGMKIAEDLYMWIRIARRYEVCFSPERLVRYSRVASNRSAASYTPEKTVHSFEELYDPLAPEEDREFVARAALGKALIISAKGGTKEAARAARFFAWTRTYRRTLRKVRALNALPAGWRGPVIRLYNALAWRLARKGL